MRSFQCPCWLRDRDDDDDDDGDGDDVEVVANGSVVLVTWEVLSRAKTVRR